MKILVYGAGVIGCYLAHVLCGAGHSVTVAARGEWAETMERDGLVIRHYLQRTTTTDRPRVIRCPAQEPYDVVFSVMQHQQQWDVLEDLARVNSPLVVLVGNNLDAPEMERRIVRRSAQAKTVLFGFQGTGGRRENGVVHCVRMGPGSMTVGRAHGPAPNRAKAALLRLFRGTGYRLSWAPDMDGWYKCHLALILPACYLCYSTGCDLRRATARQRQLLLDAAGEAYGLLAALGTPILPEGEESYYRPGPKRAVLAAMIWVMAKTALGDLAASDHCRHAVTEMQGLDQGFAALRAQRPDFPMPAWDTLRGAMPAWDALPWAEKNKGSKEKQETV